MSKAEPILPTIEGWEIVLAILLAAVPFIGWMLALAIGLDAIRADSQRSLPDSESVTHRVDHRPACRKRRLCAGGIDALVTYGLYTLPYLGWIGAVFYAFFRDTPVLGGRSLGKRVFGLAVVVYSGPRRVGGDYLTAFRRNLLIAAPLLQIVGFLIEGGILLRGGSRRRLGDRWAGTEVLDLSGRGNLDVRT